MAKIGLAQWELDQLVTDLKAGKSWDEIRRTRLAQLDPKVLEASDYKEYAHTHAGIPDVLRHGDGDVDDGESGKEEGSSEEDGAGAPAAPVGKPRGRKRR
jgi:hypothetical protein